jgi:hypothetical protein
MATTPDPTAKVKGPASYFPSIEKTYGRPIDEWLEIVRPKLAAGERHSDIVNELKSEYGMGHGHANAVVAFVKAEKA